MASFRFPGPQCTVYSEFWWIDPQTMCWQLTPLPGIVESADSLQQQKQEHATGAVATSTAASNLSGAAWWHANQAKYPNSTSVDDLAPSFRPNVKAFLQALDDAGADVRISTTRRNKLRAYLMHYSWLIANGEIKPANVPAADGVTIVWDHGDDAKSRRAAREMVKLFDMAHIAVLNSRHIAGTAIDMTITWDGTLKIKNKAGKTVDIGAPRNGADNTTLHEVGSSYGVKKLLSDRPHWSSDGH